MTTDLPNNMIEVMWTNYVQDKVMYAILSEDPGIGLRFVFDFQDKWREWPFYSVEAVGRMGITVPDDPGDNLLAVFDADADDPVGITNVVAKLMTAFGPPAVAICFSDAYTVRMPKDEPEPDVILPLVDDLTLNPDSKVEEALLCHATNYLGQTWGRAMTYTWKDGVLVFAEPVSDYMEASTGPLSDLLSASVSLYGSNSPRDVLVAIANGDEAGVDEMIAEYQKSMDEYRRGGN